MHAAHHDDQHDQHHDEHDDHHDRPGPGEEQVHVEKQPVVKEEVTIRKRDVQDTERVSGTVRKDEVKVEKEGDVKLRGKDRKST